MRDETALTVPHRFKVKVFSSIWNARGEATAPARAVAVGRASAEPLALPLLYLSMEAVWR